MNPYSTPNAVVADEPLMSAENNSGGGKDIIPPPGVKGWSTGAFLFNWIWAISNKTWIGLLAFIPYVGFIFALYLGFKGRELAWRNKRWESLERFLLVQKRWSVWGGIIYLGIAGIGILAAILIPAIHRTGS